MSKKRKPLSRLQIGRIIAAGPTPAVAADKVWDLITEYVDETETRIIEAEFKATEAAQIERAACANMVPTNWCDVLLTGKDAAKVPLDCRGVEQLLRGVQDRIRNAQSA